MERSTFRETIGGPLKLFVSVTFGLNEHNRFHISSILDGISILFIFCIWSFLFLWIFPRQLFSYAFIGMTLQFTHPTFLFC